MNSLLSISSLIGFKKSESLTPPSPTSTSTISESSSTSSFTDYFKNVFEKVVESIFSKSLSDEDLFRIMKKVSPKITLEQIKKISLYIQQNSERLLQQAKNEDKDLIVHSHTKKEGLARSVVFTKTGHVYILCNRVNKFEDKLLGEGGVKKVTTAVDLMTGTIVASAGAVFTNDREITVLNSVKGDQRFIQIIDTVAYEDKMDDDVLKYRTFFKFYEKGDLSGLLKKSKGLSLANKKSIFEKLIHGVHHLHGLGLLHRDLKPENVLLEMEDGIFVPVVADLGSAVETQDAESKGFYSTTKSYASPELAIAFNKARASKQGNFLTSPVIAAATTEASDVWSLGCILYDILGLNMNGNSLPWFEGRDDDDDKDIMDRIAETKEDWWPHDPAGNHSPITLIKQMLEVDPEKRITMDQAKERLKTLQWDSLEMNAG